MQKLLDQSVFPGSTPNHSVILVAHQKANRHYSELSIVDGRPTLRTLMYFLANHSQHSRNTRPADIDIKQADLILLRKQNGKLGGYRALSHSSFARQDQDFVLDVFEFLADELDSGIDLDFA